MIKSWFIDGTNKKAFVITDGVKQIMFTYARPAVYVESAEAEPQRIWDNFRINSGKHIIKFNPALTKKTWEAMEVKPAPCTGKFVIEGKMPVEVDFKNMSYLVLNGNTILAKEIKTGKFYKFDTGMKFPKRYIDILNKFAGKELTATDWDSFEVNERLSF